MKWKTYRYMFSRLYDFINTYDLFSGCDPFQVCQKLGISCIPYSEGDNKRLLEMLKDGFSLFQDGDFYIFYSDARDKLESKRVNFTISHELGHFVLLHHQILGAEILAQNRSGAGHLGADLAAAEEQADKFAHNLLMPVEKTQELLSKNTTRPELCKIFGVSKAMLETRLGHLKEDEKRLKTICKTCSLCGAQRIEYLPYCHICGTAFLEG